MNRRSFLATSAAVTLLPGLPSTIGEADPPQQVIAELGYPVFATIGWYRCLFPGNATVGYATVCAKSPGTASEWTVFNCTAKILTDSHGNQYTEIDCSPFAPGWFLRNELS